jgi:hypothetical protein
MDDSARDYFLKRKHTVYRYTGYTYTIRRTGVFDQGIICAKACTESDEVKKPLI